MSTDAELLRDYAQGGSETAFTELVARHVNLVYGAAIRQSRGNVTMAEDITQAAFNEMARKADALSRHPVLSGWLYNYVRHLTANQRRADRRRQQREQASIKMNSQNASSEPDTLWEEVKPVLDDAMHGLNEQDRTAVALRFHENLSLRDVGEALGLSENAARMRVGRALDKLRNLLAQRGVTSTTSSLTAALGVGASVFAPPGMAATIAVEALAANACVGTATASTTVATIMNMTKLKITLAAVLVTAGVGLTVSQERRIESLVQENSSLQADLSQLPDLRAEVKRLQDAAAADPGPSVELDLENERLESKREIAGLRGRLNMALTMLAEHEASSAAATNQATLEEAVAPKMKEIMRAGVRIAVEQQTLGKLPLLTERLALSPEQEKAARSILQSGFDQGLELATNMLSGKLTQEGVRAKKGLRDPWTEIQALLTPEQKVAYEEYQQEEKVSKARVVANGELLEMQQASLGLTQEQQDQAFEALYHMRMTNPSPPPADPPVSEMQWLYVDRKVSAVEELLTPVQLEQYRQILEQKMKLMTDVMPASMMPEK